MSGKAKRPCIKCERSKHAGKQDDISRGGLKVQGLPAGHPPPTHAQLFFAFE